LDEKDVRLRNIANIAGSINQKPETGISRIPTIVSSKSTTPTDFEISNPFFSIVEMSIPVTNRIAPNSANQTANPVFADFTEL
jgi:hypothetical protein